MKKKRSIKMDPQLFRSLATHILAGMPGSQGSEKILFCDEIKLPLYQAADNAWLIKNELDETKLVELQARPDNSQLVLMILCSCEGFVSVQVCLEDIRGIEFLNYLQRPIQTLPEGRYRILADCAKWHKGPTIENTSSNQFLLLNIPGLYDINLIENSFSAIRAAFRRRPMMESLAEQISFISKEFFREDNKKRFRGYCRNLLRSIVRLGERIESDLDSDN